MKIVKSKGFSLLELTIVIAIMTILTGIGAISYENYQQKARDTRRISDLSSIAAALEIFFEKNHFYPKQTGSNCQFQASGFTFFGWCSSSDLAQNPWIPNLTTDYIANLPRDPKPTNGTDPSLVSPFNPGSFNYAYHSCPADETDQNNCGREYFLITRLENSKANEITESFSYSNIDGSQITVNLPAANQPLVIKRSP